jgi:hypothetical protein
LNNKLAIFIAFAVKFCEFDLQAAGNVGKLANQSANSVRLDLEPLSAAVQNQRAKKTAQKTYDAQKAVYDHFDGMASSAEDSEQFHRNRRDAELVMQRSTC